MSPRTLVIGCALLLAALGTPAAGAGGATVCGPAAAHTLAADQQARVYAISDGVFGCAHGASAPVSLGGSTSSCLGSARIGPVALAGTTAAYAAERCGIDTGATSVIVRRLTDGRQLAGATAGTPPGPESYTSVTALVVRAGGAAAWIASSRSIGLPRASIEVWRLTNRVARRLDHGPRIAVHSLRLRGRRLTWRDGRATRSATLA